MALAMNEAEFALSRFFSPEIDWLPWFRIVTSWGMVDEAASL